MKVPQFEPDIGLEEATQVLEALRDNWITEGPKSDRFVEGIKEVTGAKHVALVPNGTLALFVGLKVLGVGPGDEVIVPDFTFLASASSVVLTGAKPVLVDIDPANLQMDPGAVRDAVTPQTRAIMPVQIYGQAADMDPIMEIAGEHDLKVIEDAAQGIGVTYKDRHVGTFGDIGTISFFADKTITTAEGGAVLTDNDELGAACQYFKNQGRLERGSFLHPYVGFNFRLTDLQAALGLAQLAKLPMIIERKRKMERTYRELLEGVKPVSFIPPDDHTTSRVPFRTNIMVPDPEALGAHLEGKGIGVRRFFYPLHKQPCFNADNSRVSGDIRHSVEAFDRGLSLPSSVRLTTEQIGYVCNAIREFYA